MRLNLVILFFSFQLLLSFITKGFSQDVWDLETCIRYALENNIRVRQQKIATNIAENNYRQSRMDIYPSLNASSSYGISFGRALDQTTYQFTEDQTIQSSNMSLSSGMTLFSGFRKQHTIRQNAFNLQSVLQDLEKLKDDISLNIAASYLQILFNKELLSVSENQLDITRQQVERTSMLVDAGSLPKGSLLEIQAQEASEEVQVISAENQLNLSYLNLIQMLDLDVTEPFSILIPDLPAISEDELLTGVEQVYDDAIERMPQIKGSEYRVKSAEKNLDIMRSYRSPAINLSGTYGSGYSDIRQRIIDAETRVEQIGTTAGGEPVFAPFTFPVYTSYSFFNQLKDNANTSLFLSVSVPIFNGRQISNNIDNAKLGVINSRLELEYAKKILYEEITRAYADAIAALKKFNASEKAVAAMEESFKYTREKYELGLVTSVDFNIVKNQMVKAQSDMLQAKYDFIFKTNILNFYRGKPIKI